MLLFKGRDDSLIVAGGTEITCQKQETVNCSRMSSNNFQRILTFPSPPKHAKHTKKIASVIPM